MKKILIVDDELGSRESIKAVFSKIYEVATAATAEEALTLLARARVNLILMDVMMPGKDGVTLLKEIHELYPDVPVIMVSASSSVRPVVEAIRVGAYDFLTKPFDVDELRHIAERAISSSSLKRKVEILQGELSKEFPVDEIVGAAPSFRKSLEDAIRAADSDATVLIAGESGTGKELVARLVHSSSSRVDEPFVAIHCAALPETLMESELFGYEKGAFTNANQRKMGRFDLAGSGTLFLDEVSEMALPMQVKLLRVLQEREFMRVGGTKVIKTDSRILAATNKDLKQEVAEGRFREDLYYRLSVVPVQLPPLRERREDIPLLAQYFLGYFRKKMEVSTEDFEEEALEALIQYFWPGNVRELRNLVERLLVLHRRQATIRYEFLPEEFRPSNGHSLPTSPYCTLEEAVNIYERKLVEDALLKANGVQTRAAEILGTTRRILKYRMEKLDIPSRPA